MEREKGGKEIDLEKVVNSAVSEGIEAIVKNHPRFSKLQPFLAKYVDRERLNGYLAELKEAVEANPEEGERLVGEFYQNTASYVASGELLDERGKELVLRKSFGNNRTGRIKGRTSREILRGEEYLDQAMDSFQDIYNLFSSGEYNQRMPELVGAVSEIYDAGFKDAALNVLYGSGLLNEGKYETFKRALRKRAQAAVESVPSAIDKSFGEKVAASVIAIFGILLIGVNNSITGNVVGVSPSTNLITFIAGLALFITGTFLWLKEPKR